jgi:hypothetical protein
LFQLTLSLFFITAVCVVVLIRAFGLKLWQAAIVMLFGFLLAGSQYGPMVREALADLFNK